MRIKVELKLNTELEIPIAYRYCLQSAIYGALRGNKDYNDRHDNGYSNGTQKFKGFTFSDLLGQYEINENSIIFEDACCFFVSSPDSNLVRTIAGDFLENGIRLDRHIISQVVISKVQEPDFGSGVTIKMLSPLCVKESIRDTGETTYYNPMDAEFEWLVNRNFQRKYAAIIGEVPTDKITIEPLFVEPKHKKIVLYKGIIYEGWMGQYRVTGNPKYLKFLYEIGIGSENSKGLGMFEVIEHKKYLLRSDSSKRVGYIS